MKKLTLLTLLGVWFISCKDSGLAKNNAYDKCQFGDGWYIENVIHDKIGTVKIDSTSLVGPALYYIDFEPKWSIGISPCNLPDSVWITKHKVKISGTIYNNPFINISSLPLEVSQFSVIE